jgi:DNA polymerase I-like protein with 3'-5' exonuclease and polymerase domains
VGHTHDELILEVKKNEVGDAEPALAGVMLDIPNWADGLPMNCETWNGERYRK